MTEQKPLVLRDYEIAAKVMEKMTGQTAPELQFRQLVKGMQASGWTDEEIMSGLDRLYKKRRDKMAHTGNSGSGGAGGAGNISVGGAGGGGSTGRRWWQGKASGQA